jgi:hypothetical protein
MIDFNDLVMVKPVEWDLANDPIGLLSYQMYKRRRGLIGENYKIAYQLVNKIGYITTPSELLKTVKEYITAGMAKLDIQRHDAKIIYNISFVMDKSVAIGVFDPSVDSLVRIEVNAAPLVVTEQIDEALTIQQRMKRKILMKRLAPRIARARKRAMKRRAGMDVLKRRARALARKTIAKKLLGGRNKADVSTAEKNRIEKLLAKKQSAINRLSTRLLAKVRKTQAMRFAKKKVAPAATPNK